MSQCPKCGYPVEHDFGVTSCAKCAAVLFVDFNGEIQVADSSSEGAQPVSDELPGLSLQEQSEFSSPLTDPTEMGEPSSAFGIDQASVASPLAENLYTSEQSESPPEEAVPDNHSPSEFETSDETLAPEWTGEDVAEVQAGAALSTDQVAPSNVDFSDVLEFANQTGELDNSPLIYHLWIEGIDHRETRRRVESVLAEPRLNFYLKDVLPAIRGGVLELRGLSPAKAGFIANRLREEEVQFRWRQSVYASEEATEEISPTGTES